MMKKKSEAEIEAMEKSLKKRPEPRPKTEYEIMKESKSRPTIGGYLGWC